MPTVQSVPSRQRWIAPVLVVVFALTLSGGLLAREWYAVDGSVGGSVGGGNVTTSPSATRRVERQPGPPTVELSADASAHPRGGEIRALLQRYFDAINQRDYRMWTSAVTARWARAKPEQQWRTAYRSTTDGSIRLYRIETLTEQRLRLLVGFTSTQDPQDAPAALPVGCIRWHLVLPAVAVGGQWKLDRAPAGTAPEFAKCPPA